MAARTSLATVFVATITAPARAIDVTAPIATDTDTPVGTDVIVDVSLALTDTVPAAPTASTSAPSIVAWTVLAISFSATAPPSVTATPTLPTDTANEAAVATDVMVEWSVASTVTAVPLTPKPSAARLSLIRAVIVMPTSFVVAAPPRATPPAPPLDAATAIATPVETAVIVASALAVTDTAPVAATPEPSIAAVT